MDLYALLCLILGLPIGLYFYRLLNKYFEIYYFGCGGVWATFWGCLVAGAIIMFILLEFLRALAIPVAVFFFILWLLSRGKKNNQNTSSDDQQKSH